MGYGKSPEDKEIDALNTERSDILRQKKKIDKIKLLKKENAELRKTLNIPKSWNPPSKSV